MYMKYKNVKEMHVDFSASSGVYLQGNFRSVNC